MPEITPKIIPTPAPLESLRRRFEEVRTRSSRLAAPLPVEDQVLQTMSDVSPTRWHLAHTTWFFEVFVLGRFLPSYQPFDSRFDYLFNSYYQGAGPQFPRPMRGMLGRPTLATIAEYRSHVDRVLDENLERLADSSQALFLIEVGLQHEEQHQELILTDIKHVLATNPLRPAYRDDCGPIGSEAAQKFPPLNWSAFAQGVYQIGHDGPGFSFDNERPRHKVYVPDFELANRPVTCGEFADFIADGGYEDPQWWLSLGWQCVQERGWRAPLYWERRGDKWWTMTLGGMGPVQVDEPICHVSYFEADAYARWAGARLPTEAQWEVASQNCPVEGNLAHTERYHPRPVISDETWGDATKIQGLFGDVWEWTASSYAAYPGFEPWDDVLGEYNGKFMCNQYILRGGSCVTPADHIRRTYRNFFPPDARWQFSGFRLAR